MESTSYISDLMEGIAAGRVPLGDAHLALARLPRKHRNPEVIARILAAFAAGSLPVFKLRYVAIRCAKAIASESALSPQQALYDTGAFLKTHQDVDSLLLAIQCFHQARQLDCRDPLNYARALVEEGNTRLRLTELGIESRRNAATALALFQEARSHLHLDSWRYGVVLVNEGGAMTRMAEFETKPQPLLREALLLYAQGRERLRPGTPEYVRSFSNEATTRQKLAQLGDAPVENLLMALQFYGQASAYYGPPSPKRGQALVNSGNARVRLANWGLESEDNLRLALALYEEGLTCLQGDRHQYGVVLRLMGDVHRRLAEISDSLSHLESALAHFEQARGYCPPGSRTVNSLLLSESAVRQDLAGRGIEPVRNLGEAKNLCIQALGSLQPDDRVCGTASILQANAHIFLSNQGLDSTNNLKAAVALYERALTVVALHSPEWSIACRNEAHILHRLGASRAAYARLSGGLLTIEKCRSAIVHEHERIAYFETATLQYAAIVALCLDVADQEPDSKEAQRWRWRAWHWVHRSKSRTLLELLTKQNVGAQHRAGVDSPLGNPREKSPVHAVDSPVPQARDVLRHLRRLSGIAANTSANRSLLVELFILAEDEFAVFLVPIGNPKKARVVRIGARLETLQRLAQTVSEAIRVLTENAAALPEDYNGDARSTQRHQAHNQVNTALETLGSLFEPWMDLLPDFAPSELIIAPHYLFTLLPIHALPWQGTPLIARFPIAYLPSPAIAGEINARSSVSALQTLIVSNPTSDLPSADQEAAAVLEEVEAAGFHGRVLSGTKATSHNVLYHAPKASILHFAGHSRLDHQHFLDSGIELADKRMTGAEILASLDLRKATLVFLSSCDSARAHPARSEELMALIRALLCAGSPTVLASLWALEDRVGIVFARSFYHHWLTGNASLITAYQRAVLDTRELYPQAFYWTPFVLVGAWHIVPSCPLTSAPATFAATPDRH